MTTDTAKDSPHCMICNNKIGVSTRNSIRIFEEKSQSELGKTLVDQIRSILEIDINENNVHSHVICKKCYRVFNEFSELETRMMEIRHEVLDNYRKTIKLNNIIEIPEKCNDHDYVDCSEAPIVINSPVKNENHDEIIDDSSFMDAKDEPDEEHLDPYFQDEINQEENENSDVAQENIEETVVEKVTTSDPLTMVKLNQQGKKKDIKSTIKDKEDSEDALVSRNGESYVCLLCPNDRSPASGDAKEIIKHMKAIHETRLYICDICGEDFKKRNLLSLHLDDHVAKEEGDFQCEVCNRIFSNLRLFRIHKRIHYPQAKSWSCEQCGKRYSSKNLLDEHINTHIGVRPYVCEYEGCGKDFASKYTYKAHAKTHEARDRPFECMQCNKTFLSQQNLNQHEKTHLGVKEHICMHCGKAFGSSHNLDVHTIVHTGYKPYICRMCGKAFARKAEIRDHERTHTGEKPYQCDVCGVTFSQRSNLQSHKRATHLNDKRYKCDECGKGFKRRRLLDYHIKAAHTGERPYKCDQCIATFVYPEHFKKHMRIHTGEKPYLCEVCGKAFNSRDNRNAHRFIHSDKKPYECLVCGMGFMRKPLLYTHMQTQNHLNDTIVVNQPRLTTEEELITIPEGDVQLLMEEGDADQLGETELYVTELKEHVIIQDDDDNIYQESDVLNIPTDADIGDEQVEHIVVDSQMTYTEDEIVHCKQENEQVEEVYNYDNEEDETIVVPATDDYKNIIGDNKNQVRLVQIRIQSDSGTEEKGWLSLVQQHT